MMELVQQLRQTEVLGHYYWNCIRK